MGKIKVEGRCSPAGTVQAAHFTQNAPPFSAPNLRTAAQRSGITYERKLQFYLQENFPHHVGAPWLRFLSKEFGARWCQPDALLFDFDAGTIVVVECKLKHHARAFYQLRTLYYPVLASIFPPDLWTIKLVEVVCWFDPSAYFPGSYEMIPSLTADFTKPIGVHIWNPQHQ